MFAPIGGRGRRTNRRRGAHRERGLLDCASRRDARRGAGARFRAGRIRGDREKDLELGSTEAYYVLWSRHLAFGYLDHPPMVAVWIRLSTLIFGSAEFGVRALNVVAFALTPAMIGFAAARLFDCHESAPSRRWPWLATPLIAGGFLATPDTPLIFFSIVALMGLVEAGARASLGLGDRRRRARLGAAIQVFGPVPLAPASRSRCSWRPPSDVGAFRRRPALRPASPRRRSLRHSSIGTPPTARRRSPSSSAACPPTISGCSISPTFSSPRPVSPIPCS